MPDDQLVAASINEITASPDAWSEKWVKVSGVLRFGEIESWLLAKKDPPLGIYGPDALGIEMAENRRTISESLDGKLVEVTGQVDITCVEANRAVEAAQTPNRIVYAGGFCHESIGPHLVSASARAIRSPQ